MVHACGGVTEMEERRGSAEMRYRGRAGGDTGLYELALPVIPWRAVHGTYGTACGYASDISKPNVWHVDSNE